MREVCVRRVSYIKIMCVLAAGFIASTAFSSDDHHVRAIFVDKSEHCSE